MEKFVEDDVYKDFDPELRRSFDVVDEASKELKDYSKVKIQKDSILLSGDRTFYTLQGEGPTLGKPCVFVRLHVCNLRCTWCDAFYTWSPHSKEFWTEGSRVSFSECAELIKRTWEGPKDVQKRVIWSGGEPLIQKKQIDQAMRELDNRYSASGRDHVPASWLDWQMEIETNGTLMPTDAQLRCAQFNCSPKLSNSDNKHYSMVKPKVLEALNKVNTTFKFVCRNEDDLKEIEGSYCEHISREKIIIMPEGIIENEISEHAKALYKPVLKRGWQMTPRFQAIFADGARRGV